jgi:Tripartite ATP-independent periplasmic transporter, DctM component
MKGLFLANAKLGSDLFALANALIGRFRGGMAMATIGAGALFASVCGSSIATASTIATVTVPEMRKYNYNEGFAAGAAAPGLPLLDRPDGRDFLGDHFPGDRAFSAEDDVRISFPVPARGGRSSFPRPSP